MSLKYLRISALNSILPETFLIILFSNETGTKYITQMGKERFGWIILCFILLISFTYILNVDDYIHHISCLNSHCSSTK